MQRSDEEQDDAQDTALVQKPAAVKAREKTTISADTAQENEETTMVEVEQDPEASLAPQRSQSSRGKLKAMGRRPMLQD